MRPGEFHSKLCALILSFASDSPDVDIQYIGGADPEMVFLDKDYNEVEVGDIILL